MNLPNTAETALADDVEALRQRFPQTQALYREVCALLFFRYGITPTTNKLYQLVRKGSMSAPAQALSDFWQELRDKSRVRIEHPDLPDALASAAGELMAGLWAQAQTAAQDSLAVLQTEARATVAQAQAQVAELEAEGRAHALQNQKLIHERNQLYRERDAQREELAATAATRASLLAALKDSRDDNAGLQQQLEAARQDFGAELDKLRESAQLAEARARGTEKRLLVEMDRERSASAKLQKEAETLRKQATTAASLHQQESAALQQALGDIKQEKGQLEGALQSTGASLAHAHEEITTLRQALQQAQAEARAAVVRPQRVGLRRTRVGSLKRRVAVPESGRTPRSVQKE